MRIFYAVSFLIILGVCIWDVQRLPSLPTDEPSSVAPYLSPPPVTYVLIDASGSMVGSDAEAVVDNILAPIRKTPNAQVSRTYFRAATTEACHAPVPISEPVPVLRSTAQPQAYRDDFTPTGEALKAALLHAVKAGVPANIYLVSDEDQTPGCGVDLCSVANSLLPLSGIVVSTVPVSGTSSSNRDRFGCVDVSQARAGALVSPSVGWRAEGGTNARSATFLERWTWLLLFFLVALSALLIGFEDLKRSVSLAEKIDKARSYGAAFERGDESSKTKLRELLESEPTLLKDEMPSSDAGKRSRWEGAKSGIRKALKRFNRSLVAPKFWYLWFGCGCLLVLALMSSDEELPNYRVGVAQKAAWDVLDTNFATAFAVTWIALIVFWGTQNQRRRESEHRFLIAAKEAERARDIRDATALANEARAYRNVYDDISRLEFAPPWDQWRDYEDRAAYTESFDRVQEAAIRIALGEELPFNPTLDQLKDGAARLKARRPSLQRRGNFGKFVQRLSSEGLLVEHVQEWNGVYSALTASDRTDKEVRDSIRILADALNASR